MADHIVAGTSKFHIYSSFTMSNDDYNSLALLYTPLIGADALSLYMVFQSLLERNNLKSEEIIHQDLFDLYSLKPIDFYKSRTRLEGIGLLITYEKDEEYIYVLCPPLSPKNFIKDTTFGLYLYSKIRKETFMFIKKHFEIEKPNPNEYTNVTKSFDEIYTSRVDNDVTFDKFSYILGKNPGNTLFIKNYSFDFDEFLKQIDTRFLEEGVTSTFKKQIMDLAYVYRYDEKRMAYLYIDSINKKELFDYRMLKRKANQQFEYDKNMQAPKLQLKEQTVDLEGDLETWVDNASPEELLNELMQDVPGKYLDIVNSLYTQFNNLPKGVVNCMIIKTVRDKGGELPTVAYFKKVAESWSKDNIYSTKDAIKYITTTKEAPKKNQKKEFTSENKTKIEWEEL